MQMESGRTSALERIGVVMAGGSGERFWPLSTGKTPKQLLCLTHPTKNMLEEAVERLLGAVDSVVVSTSTLLAEPIRESGVVPARNVLAEPLRRNTLGALVWVVAELMARGGSDASVAVVTADHFIGEPVRFRGAVKFALNVAEETGRFVTLGITPTRPEVGYGYIELDELREEPDGEHQEWTSHRAVAFKEKPTPEVARDYVASRRFLWNSGMFFFTLEGFRKELGAVQPAAAVVLDLVVAALRTGDQQAACDAFASLENVSIDYAVMEKVDTLLTVPVNFPWDDVGAWDALHRTGEPNDRGNSIRGNPILIDVDDSVVVQADAKIHLTLLGVRDLIVVSTGDAVLVCHRSEAQRVRELARLVAQSAVPVDQ